MAGLLRPTFELRPGLSAEEASSRLRRLADAPGGGIVGQAVKRHMTFTVAREQRRVFSPWLHVDVREPGAEDTGGAPLPEPWRHVERVRTEGEGADAGGVGETGCVLQCRYSPAPGLWTGMMLTHIALFTLALLGFCTGVAQWTLERPPTFFWSVPAVLVLMLALVGVARVGQTLAQEEMEMLRARVEAALRGEA